LLAQAALVLDPGRPRHYHVLLDAAERRGVLLEPEEGCIERPRPAGRHVVVGLLGAPDVEELHLHVDGQFVEAVKETIILNTFSDVNVDASLEKLLAFSRA
jgi:hypothetical protein